VSEGSDASWEVTRGFHLAGGRVRHSCRRGRNSEGIHATVPLSRKGRYGVRLQEGRGRQAYASRRPRMPSPTRIEPASGPGCQGSTRCSKGPRVVKGRDTIGSGM